MAGTSVAVSVVAGRALLVVGETVTVVSASARKLCFRAFATTLEQGSTCQDGDGGNDRCDEQSSTTLGILISLRIVDGCRRLTDDRVIGENRNGDDLSGGDQFSLRPKAARPQHEC